MAEESHLALLEKQIAAIPQSELRTPDMPAHKSVSESLALQSLAIKDQKQLSIRKLDWSYVETLRSRALGYQEADAIFWIAQFGDNKLIQLWQDTYSEAKDILQELTHGMLYAFDGNDTLTDAVHDIQKGDSFSDTVSDCSLVEILGIANKELLDMAGIDFSYVQRCGELKIILGDLLAKTTAEKLEKSPESIMRNRAFTYMDIAVEKIRKCGKSVFWKNPAHAAAYASDYHRRQQRKYEKTKKLKAQQPELVDA